MYIHVSNTLRKSSQRFTIHIKMEVPSALNVCLYNFIQNTKVAL